MKLSELLRRGHCVGAYAKRVDGEGDLGFNYVSCSPYKPDACLFCLVGGLKHLGLYTEAIVSNLVDLCLELFPEFPAPGRDVFQGHTDLLINFNDRYASHAQVIYLAGEAERRGILRYRTA